MQIQSAPKFNQPKALKKSDDNGQQPEPPANHNAISEFYDRYETPVHLAGGALLGAGLARLCGLPSEAVMSAAGTGALAGYFAGDKKQAAIMAGGAAVGAAIASLAGVPGPAVLGAAGTGTLVAYLFS